MQSAQEPSVNKMLEQSATRGGLNLSHEASMDEGPKQRVERIYRSSGGPLMGWLRDEAHKRGQSVGEMAAALGVTYGYVLQLCNGIRKVENLSQDVFVACARYLGVPAVVCKLLAGNIRMADFLVRAESEEEAVDRAFRQMMDDPKVRSSLPSDAIALGLEAKRAMVLMYAEVSGHDIFGAKQLPEIVYWLQRAAVLYDDAGYQAQLDLE